MPLPDLAAAWHTALAESVNHEWQCPPCQLRDTLGRPSDKRCAEGARLYDAEQAAWREHKAHEYLGVA